MSNIIISITINPPLNCNFTEPPQIHSFNMILMMPLLQNPLPPPTPPLPPLPPPNFPATTIIATTPTPLSSFVNTLHLPP